MDVTKMNVSKEASEYFVELKKSRSDCKSQERELDALMARYRTKVRMINQRYMRKIQKLKLKYY